jgi:hypothetical protein
VSGHPSAQNSENNIQQLVYFVLHLHVPPPGAVVAKHLPIVAAAALSVPSHSASAVHSPPVLKESAVEWLA